MRQNKVWQIVQEEIRWDTTGPDKGRGDETRRGDETSVGGRQRKGKAKEKRSSRRQDPCQTNARYDVTLVPPLHTTQRERQSIHHLLRAARLVGDLRANAPSRRTAAYTAAVASLGLRRVGLISVLAAAAINFLGRRSSRASSCTATAATVAAALQKRLQSRCLSWPPLSLQQWVISGDERKRSHHHEPGRARTQGEQRDSKHGGGALNGAGHHQDATLATTAETNNSPRARTFARRNTASTLDIAPAASAHRTASAPPPPPSAF